MVKRRYDQKKIKKSPQKVTPLNTVPKNGVSQEHLRSPKSNAPHGPSSTSAFGRSHFDDDFFVFTNSGEGINLGVTALFEDELHLPLYAEYQLFTSPVGGGAGWFYDPLSQASGPQLTVFTGFLYGRLEVALDGTTALHGGLLIKYPTWAWVSAR